MNNNVYAAIAMALYEAKGLMVHDVESGKITIKSNLHTAWATPRHFTLNKL